MLSHIREFAAILERGQGVRKKNLFADGPHVAERKKLRTRNFALKRRWNEAGVVLW
jgi:hypothetical protein